MSQDLLILSKTRTVRLTVSDQMLHQYKQKLCNQQRIFIIMEDFHLKAKAQEGLSEPMLKYSLIRLRVLFLI